MLKKSKSFVIILIFVLSSVTTMVLGFDTDILDRQIENERFQNIGKMNYLINYIEDIHNKINSNDNLNTGSFFRNNGDNSTICGFVKDNSSNLPIENAHVYILYQNLNETGEIYTISAYTNQTGWYKLIIPRSDYIDLLIYTLIIARAQKYFWNTYNIDFTQNQDFYWANISLTKGRAPETSTIKGYITDEKTGDYLNGAFVMCGWRDSQNNNDLNITYSDQNGYFQMNVTNGFISLYIFHPSHLTYLSDEYWIYAWENRWLNFSLIPILERNAVIKGHIYNSKTGDPIENVDVELRWKRKNTIPNLYGNDTPSDSQGYFMMKTAEGNIYLKFKHEDSYYYETPMYEIDGNEIYILNISLEPYYHVYKYEWTKKSGYNDFGYLFVNKNEPYFDSFTITSPTGSVLTSVEVNIKWEDDNTYGFFIKKGEDTLTSYIGLHGREPIIESSKGSGNLTFNYKLNDIPFSDYVLAEDIADAESIIDGMFSGENAASFNAEVSVETGERFWRLLKFLKDQGNEFDMSYEYVYYEYFVEEI